MVQGSEPLHIKIGSMLSCRLNFLFIIPATSAQQYAKFSGCVEITNLLFVKKFFVLSVSIKDIRLSLGLERPFEWRNLVAISYSDLLWTKQISRYEISLSGL